VIAPKTASPEETRERILTAAREVIARKGKRGATTREIADVAGVNEATLFRHFGTKEALLIAVAERCCPVGALRDTVQQATGSPSEDLLQVGRFLLNHFDANHDIIAWAIAEADYEHEIFASTAWRPQLTLLSGVVEVMSRHVSSGAIHGDPRRLAMFFMGVILIHVLGRKKFPVADYPLDGDAALRFYIDVFLNGVTGRE
jgi:AcrR family transcriptional regulator